MESVVNWVWSCGVTVNTGTTTAVLLCCLALLVFWRHHDSHSLPPGPYGLPVIGYLPWLNPSAPHLSMCDLVTKYGKVVSVRLGGVLVVVLADPQLVRDVLANKDTAGRAPLYLTHGIMKGYGLVCSEGEAWREQRKFVLGFMRDVGMRTAATRAAIEPRILNVASTLAKELGESTGGVDVSACLLHNVGNTMNQLIFGLTYADEDPTWVWLRHLLEEGTKLVGVAGPLNFLPWLSWLPRYRRVIRFITDNQKKTHQEYHAIITRHQQALQGRAGQEGQEGQDGRHEEARKESRSGQVRKKVQVEREEGQKEGRGDDEGGEDAGIDKQEGHAIQEEKQEKRRQEGRQVTVQGLPEEEIGREREVRKGQEEEARQHSGQEEEESHVEQERTGRDAGQEEGHGEKRHGEKEEEREQKTPARHQEGSPRHIVGAFLKERLARGVAGVLGEKEEGSFSMEQLYHVAADLFGAGSETTITTLKWHLLNMALFPEVQTRVQAELDDHALQDAPFTLAEAHLLPFTQASILETQRLRSILPLGIPHGTTQDMTIAGYRIPKGTMLLPLLWHIHHDPDHWPDPYVYRPERFLGEGGQLVKHLAFMPFQTGRRVCIGDEFARMILFAFTTTLLGQLRVGLGEEVRGDPAADPVCGISLTPRPFTLTFTPRR